MRIVHIFIPISFFIILILFCSPFSVTAFHGQTVEVSDETENVDLNMYMDLFEDEEKKWTIDEISSENFSDQFISNEETLPNYGYTSSVYWGRLQIKNLSAEEKNWLLELDNPTMDYVSIYLPTEGSFTEKKSGDLFPFHQRELEHRNFVFKVSTDSFETKTIYLRFETEGAMQLPLTLWNGDAFTAKSQMEYTLLGLLFGIAAVMAIYNLFLYFSLRHRSYIYYVIFILVNVLTQLSFLGLSYQYLWPDAVWWNNRSIVFFMCLANISGLVFAKVFLDMKRFTPRIDKLMAPIIIFNLLLIVLLYFSYPLALYIVMVSLLFFVALVIITAFLCYRQGYRPARFFLLGWFLLVVGIVITSLSDAGLIALNPFTKYAWQISSTVEIVLFSFALADRINTMRIEKAQAEKEAIESKEMALHSLKRTNKLKDEFLAVTSHEIRTPLNGIIGIAETMNDGVAGQLTETMKKNLSMIIMSGKRLSHLLDDILDFSKLKNDVLELNIKQVYLHEMAEVVLTMSQSLANGKDVSLHNRIPSTLPPVKADENRLQQILYNLIGNGIKYTEKGNVSISAKEEEDYIKLTVTDTGIGIPPDQLESIFHPFKQGEHTISGGYGGTGIGLNITKRLIELHEGTIDVTSREGEGSTFTFTLPIFQDSQNTKVEVASVYPDLPIQYSIIENIQEKKEPTRSGRILIADDEPVNLQVLINHLSLEGYEVETVNNGADALDQIEALIPFDLLILDIMMPKMSGYEVCRKIREKFLLTDLPILMLTAKNQLEDRITAFELGANDYLTKPFEKKELTSRVKTLIDLKKAMTGVRDHAKELDRMNIELQNLNDSLEDKVQERTMELQKINEKLKELNINLTKTEQSRRHLLSNISHELGTPITFLHSYVQSIKEGLIEASDTRYLQLVENKIHMLDRLTQDLFDLAKFESGKMRLNIKTENLTEWIEQVYRKFELDVEEKGIELNYPKINSKMENIKDIDILIDYKRMDQVFSNIIYNSLKYTPIGGNISIVIDVKSLDPEFREMDGDFEGEVIIAVKDTGQGIEPDVLPYIFERFYKGSTSKYAKDSGSGLGLAITKEIVQYHKGRIWVESQLNKGTTFYFTLPFIMNTVERLEDIC
ncbi:ATP-binding protein [Evansella tamaricis]|uniref:histidine kinase n=1 Tax=Evansella tamaricis TaxID=2069301 RepID=A0ABS6JMQ5_9BACI|nr:ATP-binding protein [Evansella tamaricis]MBU9713603.1 response regulator [Evansella tamaricis]